MASCGGDGWGQRVTVASRGRGAFLLLPTGLRRQVLHGLGRYAPWEPGFDFTPPTLLPGEQAGPPDFVGIGAQKCGTTWWYDLVATHPNVSTRPGIHKERHFFDRFGSQRFDEAEIGRYHGWFPRQEGMRCGEWTPDYLSLPWVPELLRRAAPDTQLLLLLRDPVSRFRSGLGHAERSGERIDTAMVDNAVQRGFYARSLDAWLRHFERDQLLILQYERCAEEPATQLRATFAFLGLPETPVTLTPVPGTSPPDMDPVNDDVARRLVAIYEEDVLRLAASEPTIDLARWPHFAHLAGRSSVA